MAHFRADACGTTTTSTGTGTLTLSTSAPDGLRTPQASNIQVGDTFSYRIKHDDLNEWECGTATYSSANTMTRSVISSSSNAGAAVAFSAGVKRVYVTLLAGEVDDIVDPDPVELTAATLLTKGAHGNRPLWVNSGSALTHTIDDDTNGGWNRIGDFVEAASRGAGIQTFAGDGTSVLTAPAGTKLWVRQNEVFTAQRVAANAWVSTTPDRGGVSREITGATMLAASDVDAVINYNSASAAAITVPADSTLGISATNVGRKSIVVHVKGAGVPTFTGSGATINGTPRSGLAQYSLIVLVHTEANTWSYA